MHVDLSHTPGLLYALAYWLSSTFYIQGNPAQRKNNQKDEKGV